MSSKYTNQQIEIANLLQPGTEVSSEILDEIMEKVVKMENKNSNGLSEQFNMEAETSIRMKIADETDWRKKASLSALIISNSLK